MWKSKLTFFKDLGFFFFRKCIDLFFQLFCFHFSLFIVVVLLWTHWQSQFVRIILQKYIPKQSIINSEGNFLASDYCSISSNKTACASLGLHVIKSIPATQTEPLVSYRRRCCMGGEEAAHHKNKHQQPSAKFQSGVRIPQQHTVLISLIKSRLNNST